MDAHRLGTERRCLLDSIQRRRARNEEESNMYATKLLSHILVAFCFGIFALSASAGNCENPRYAAKNPEECADPPTDPPTDPPPVYKTLEVTVYYGDTDTAIPGNCTESVPTVDQTCIKTTFTVKGTVTCSSQVCDFSRTNEEDSFLTGGVKFGIPPSQFNLLAKTEIRGTEIVPAYCFSTEHDSDIVNEKFDPEVDNTYSVPGLTLNDINGFWLRSPVVSTADAPGKWWAHVWAHSDDMNGVERQYRFNFGGECNSISGRCPTLRDSDFTGDFGYGSAGGVFGENTNPRGEGQTCRCTVSSKPGCPDHVDLGENVPRPAAWIEIKPESEPQP